MENKRISNSVLKQRTIKISSIQQVEDHDGDFFEVIQVVFSKYETGKMYVAEIGCGFKTGLKKNSKEGGPFIEIKRCVNGKDIDIRHAPVEEYVPVFPQENKNERISHE